MHLVLARDLSLWCLRCSRPSSGCGAAHPRGVQTAAAVNVAGAAYQVARRRCAVPTNAGILGSRGTRRPRCSCSPRRSHRGGDAAARPPGTPCHSLRRPGSLATVRRGRGGRTRTSNSWCDRSTVAVVPLRDSAEGRLGAAAAPTPRYRYRNEAEHMAIQLVDGEMRCRRNIGCFHALVAQRTEYFRQ